MFTAALFITIAKMWKQPQCLLTDKRLKKVWYKQTMEYYLAIKKNETMPFSAIWIDLEMILLSEVRQRQMPYNITYMGNLKYEMNELICQTERDSQTQRRDLWLPREGDWRREVLGVWVQPILYREWINSKVLLYSTGNQI